MTKAAAKLQSAALQNSLLTQSHLLWSELLLPGTKDWASDLRRKCWWPCATLQTVQQANAATHNKSYIATA